jgi:hypothetical protein
MIDVQHHQAQRIAVALVTGVSRFQAAFPMAAVVQARQAIGAGEQLQLGIGGLDLMTIGGDVGGT